MVALGAAVVAGFAALTVATCGGSLLALTASSMVLVASGTAAATTATTVAAAATIGAAGAYGAVVISVALDSTSVADFAAHGDCGTVISPVFGAVFGGLNGYSLDRSLNSTQKVNPCRSDSSNRKSLKTCDVNFAKRPQEHMQESCRRVPISIQVDAIRYGTESSDPRGSSAMQYSIEIFRNGTPYQLDVIFDWTKMMIYHFEYHN